MQASATANNKLIKGAFGKYLTLSILITLSATLGMMLDNVIAGNLLGPGAVAAIGMSLSVFLLFSGCAGIIETGAIALSARALGNRNAAHVNVIFSVSLLAVLVVGTLLSVSLTAAASFIANFLGAHDPTLHADTVSFLTGICPCALAIMLLQLLMGFARLDNSPQLGVIAIVAMSACDIVLNLVAVCVLNMGLFGMGLATTISYCIAVCICATHFFSKKNTLHVVNPLLHLRDIGSILKTGLPDSLTRITVMLRTFVFNHLLLIVAANNAVAVLSMLSSVNLFTSSIATGIGQTATLMCGIFYGEQDRSALKATLRIASKVGIALTLCLAVVMFIFAPDVVGIFGFSGAEFALGLIAIRLYIIREPVGILNSLFSSYYQGIGKISAASAISVGYSGFFGIIFALCAAWGFGENAIWLSFPVGEAITLIVQVIVANVIWARKHPNAGASMLDKLMYLPSNFQADWLASKNFFCEANLGAVIDCSKQVEAWCSEQGVDSKRTYLAVLGTEELTSNAVKHGFKKTKHPAIDLRITLKRGGALELHMKDNGKPFNPVEFDIENASPEEVMGIKTLRQAIKHVEYQNTIGLNNTTVTLVAGK